MYDEPDRRTEDEKHRAEERQRRHGEQVAEGWFRGQCEDRPPPEPYDWRKDGAPRG